MTLTASVRTRFRTGDATFDLDAAVEVRAGETLVVLGPSGSGKTLLLECIAGFHDHEGAVELDGRDLTDMSPERRGFGFVFQDYALFPHRTVWENVAFGTRYHDDTRDPDRLLERLGVADLADRYPGTLSGGEKQRVALARSLAIAPDALLLDEPLSALDVPTRQSLRADLADVIVDVTSLYVTHDRTTARALADRVAVMRDGRIVQTGSPEAVFERPASAFVARFTGANVVPAGVLADEEVAIRPEYVRLDGGDQQADGRGVADDHRGVADDHEGTVTRVVREEIGSRVTLDCGWGTVDALVRGVPPAVGDAVGVAFPDDRVSALDG